MSRDNVELLRALYPDPGTDICALFRDEDTFTRVLEALRPIVTHDFDLIEVGDRVVLLLRDHGRREDMDAEVEIIGASICTFRDGKLARWEDYANRSEALEAVGLGE